MTATTERRERLPNVDDEAKRAALYRLVAAVIGLAIIYGLVTPDEAEGIRETIEAVLETAATFGGVGSTLLAVRNTSRRRDDPADV